MFPFSVWGVYLRTLEGRARTNNAAEGLHNSINRHFETLHPSLGNFIKLLASFHQGVIADYRELSLGKTVSSSNRKSIEHDKNILFAVESFDKYKDIGEYLAAIGAHLCL